MTRFRDVQQAIIMTTVWVDDDKIKSDYNIKKTWDYVCVMKLNDKTCDTNETNTVHMKRDTWQVGVHVVFLLVRVAVIFTHCIPHLLAQGSSGPRVCTHLIHAWSERHSLLRVHFHEDSSNTVHSANKEMGSTDESHSHTGYEPKDHYLMETYVESLTKSLTQQQFPEQRFLEDVDYDDAALEDMLHNANRKHVYHCQREGLSVGQSSSSVSQRTGRPVVERTGKLVRPIGQEPNVGNAQIRTLLDRQKEQILADCQTEIKNHEFQTNYDRRS